MITLTTQATTFQLTGLARTGAAGCRGRTGATGWRGRGVSARLAGMPDVAPASSA